MADYREYGFKGVIAKPYRTYELCRVVHDVLNEKNQADPAASAPDTGQGLLQTQDTL
jgi:hypothetical protein